MTSTNFAPPSVSRRTRAPPTTRRRMRRKTVERGTRPARMGPPRPADDDAACGGLAVCGANEEACSGELTDAEISKVFRCCDRPARLGDDASRGRVVHDRLDPFAAAAGTEA